MTLHKSSVPMVSVVMIAYNKERYIRDAIMGVASQKFSGGLELIIMDDCSTDGTGEVCRNMAERYPEVIRYFRNEHNLGLQRNYIEGFRHVRGRYMAICDADDYWCYRRKLQVMTDYMESHPECAVAFHRVVNYYEATGEKSLSNGGMVRDSDIRALSRSNFITNLSVLYRRELVDLENLPVWIALDKSPDYAMHMLYAANGTIHFFRRPMGVYRKAAGSAWSLTGEFERQRMALTVRQHLLDQFAEREDVVGGLRVSMRPILQAMFVSGGPEEKQYVREQAAMCGIELDEAAVKAEPRARGLLSRLRGVVSKLVPLPRP